MHERSFANSADYLKCHCLMSIFKIVVCKQFVWEFDEAKRVLQDKSVNVFEKKTLIKTVYAFFERIDFQFGNMSTPCMAHWPADHGARSSSMKSYLAWETPTLRTFITKMSRSIFSNAPLICETIKMATLKLWSRVQIQRSTTSATRPSQDRVNWNVNSSMPYVSVWSRKRIRMHAISRSTKLEFTLVKCIPM